MKNAGLGGSLLLYGVIFTTTFAAEKPVVTDKNKDLRRRMAGAWRSVREQPQLDVDLFTNQEDWGEKHPFRGMSKDAIAKRIAELDQVLNFQGDLCIMASEGHQVISTVQYDGKTARCTNAASGITMPGELTLEDEMLVLRVPSMNLGISYRRLDEIPESVRLDAYVLGTRQLNATQLAAIQAEIAQRMKQDQNVRSKAMNVTEQTLSSVEGGALHAMITVDQENTSRLVELTQDVGWLSKKRFGRETQHGAFLIVQHSGSVRLMRTILPLIEEEVKGDPTLGQCYALLYDRLQLNLGKKQRYGTQTQPDPDGRITIARLEDRARINEWRKEMGMNTIEAFAKQLGSQSGVRVNIGD